MNLQAFYSIFHYIWFIIFTTFRSRSSLIQHKGLADANSSIFVEYHRRIRRPKLYSLHAYWWAYLPIISSPSTLSSAIGRAKIANSKRRKFISLTLTQHRRAFAVTSSRSSSRLSSPLSTFPNRWWSFDASATMQQIRFVELLACILYPSLRIPSTIRHSPEHTGKPIRTMAWIRKIAQKTGEEKSQAMCVSQPIPPHTRGVHRMND